jgi:hypothetical protein
MFVQGRVDAAGRLGDYINVYGCETWSLTLKEEHRLKGAEEDIWTEEG